MAIFNLSSLDSYRSPFYEVDSKFQVTCSAIKHPPEEVDGGYQVDGLFEFKVVKSVYYFLKIISQELSHSHSAMAQNRWSYDHGINIIGSNRELRDLRPGANYLERKEIVFRSADESFFTQENFSGLIEKVDEFMSKEYVYPGDSLLSVSGMDLETYGRLIQIDNTHLMKGNF